MTRSEKPSLDAWFAEAKTDPGAGEASMYLCHAEVVRSRAADGTPVSRMDVTVDRVRLAEMLGTAELMEGVRVVRAWVNEGSLRVGEDTMYVLVGGDNGDHLHEALSALVQMIQTGVVVETETYPAG